MCCVVIPSPGVPWRRGICFRLKRRFLTSPPRFRSEQARNKQDYRGVVRSRRAFEMTETELRVIAAAAIIGLNSQPKIG